MERQNQMTEATCYASSYRERLDSEFTDYIKEAHRTASEKHRSAPKAFESFLKFNFALNAAKSVTSRISAKGNEPEADAPDFYGYYFATRRIHTAWETFRVSGESGKKSPTERVLQLIQELSDAMEVELDLADIDDGKILSDTTDDFRDILHFLKSP